MYTLCAWYPSLTGLYPQASHYPHGSILKSRGSETMVKGKDSRPVSEKGALVSLTRLWTHRVYISNVN